jgi:hypothetical protein
MALGDGIEDALHVGADARPERVAVERAAVGNFSQCSIMRGEVVVDAGLAGEHGGSVDREGFEGDGSGNGNGVRA